MLPLPAKEQTQSEESIDRELTKKLIRALKGGRIAIIGMTCPDFAESTPDKPCHVCNDGAALLREEHAICIGCTRATPQLEAEIKTILKEQETRIKFVRWFRLAAIYRRAMDQRHMGNGRRNRGAQAGRGAYEAMRARNSRA